MEQRDSQRTRWRTVPVLCLEDVTSRPSVSLLSSTPLTVHPSRHHCRVVILKESLTLTQTIMTRNESRNKSAICLFGLSADPPTGTGGHVGMVEALIPHLAATSEPQVLYLLPVYRHTFASKRNRLLPFEQRLAMCELAFAHVMQTTAASYGGRVVVEVSPAERLAFEWARQRRR